MLSTLSLTHLISFELVGKWHKSSVLFKLLGKCQLRSTSPCLFFRYLNILSLGTKSIRTHSCIDLRTLGSFKLENMLSMMGLVLQFLWGTILNGKIWAGKQGLFWHWFLSLFPDITAKNQTSLEKVTQNDCWLLISRGNAYNCLNLAFYKPLRILLRVNKQCLLLHLIFSHLSFRQPQTIEHLLCIQLSLLPRA